MVNLPSLTYMRNATLASHLRPWYCSLMTTSHNETERTMATVTGLFTTDGPDVPLAYADRDDKLRHRGDIAGILCDHYSSASYSIIGCDDCWDHAYGTCLYGICCS